MHQTRPEPNVPASTTPAVDSIVAALRTILTGGSTLPPERTLAGQLGVKRHRLRQALQHLRAQNEIAPSAQRQASAPAAQGEAMIRSTNPIEVIEMRMILEPALARLAALRASPEQITRILRAATTAPGSPPGQADLLFHRLVAVGGRNGLAADLYALLRKVGTDARLRVGNPQDGLAARVAGRDAEHQRIAQAIAARDPERAEAAMRDHLVAVQRRILAWLAPGPRTHDAAQRAMQWDAA